MFKLTKHSYVWNGPNPDCCIHKKQVLLELLNMKMLHFMLHSSCDAGTWSFQGKVWNFAMVFADRDLSRYIGDTRLLYKFKKYNIYSFCDLRCRFASIINNP